MTAYLGRSGFADVDDDDVGRVMEGLPQLTVVRWHGPTIVRAEAAVAEQDDGYDGPRVGVAAHWSGDAAHSLCQCRLGAKVGLWAK